MARDILINVGDQQGNFQAANDYQQALEAIDDDGDDQMAADFEEVCTVNTPCISYFVPMSTTHDRHLSDKSAVVRQKCKRSMLGIIC